MIAHRHLAIRGWLVCAIVMMPIRSFAAEGSASQIGPSDFRESKMERQQLLLAQHFETMPVMPPVSIPVPSPPISLPAPLPPISGPTISPQISTPTLSPSISAPTNHVAVPAGPGGPPPGPGRNTGIHVVPACTINTAAGYPSANCNYRYIYYDDLYRDFSRCDSARCFARMFLALDRSPIVVVYPAAPAAMAQAQSALHAEMAVGIRAMGAGLRQQAYNGTAGLPSISEINNLVNSAIDAVDAIDQPVDESEDQRLRRLGLTPEMVGLANQVP